jgi:hypothetical protein
MSAIARRAGTAIARRALVGAALLPAIASAQPRRIRLGTYGGSGCPARPEIEAFETFLGRRVELALDFLEKTQGWDGMLRMADWMGWCWSESRWEPVISVPMLVDGPGLTLRQAADGAFDDHFRALARILVAKGQAGAVLRLGWEFNGDWYGWSARNGTDAFVAAWRRIVAAMRGADGARFRFDWNPNLGDGPVEEAWPGAEFVDVIGLDAYNQSWPRIADPARRWRHLMDHPHGLRWHRDFAARHGKPRSFAEWGTGMRPDGHGGGDDPLYIRNMLAWMNEGGPVDYACYWNYRAGDYDAKLTDGRLPQAAAALRAGLR